MLTTNDPQLAKRMRMFRAHGISGDHRQRAALGSWFYEMVELGYNYRLSDLQCALGRSQLARLDGWLERRRSIAAAYDAALGELRGVRPVGRREGVRHAFHLYPVLLDLDRKRVYEALRAEGIGVNVHYVPVHLHPYYRKRFGYAGGELPIAEAAYERLLSLPLFPRMTDGDVGDVLAALSKVLRAFLG
jgi:perosamine synthetase